MESENLDQKIAEAEKTLAETEKEYLTKKKRIAYLKDKTICQALSDFPSLLDYYLELKDFKDKSVRMIGVDKRFLCGVTCDKNCPSYNVNLIPNFEVMSAAIRAFQAQEDYWKHKIQAEGLGE